jgi:hypothetical protein
MLFQKAVIACHAHQPTTKTHNIHSIQNKPFTGTQLFFRLFGVALSKVANFLM